MTFWDGRRRMGGMSDGNHRPANRCRAEYNMSMKPRTTTRKLLVSLLTLAIALWAEAGLALVQGDQVMQCSMSAHRMQAMGDMPCCPGEEMPPSGMAQQRPPCCSVSNVPERPLAVEVGSQRVKSQQLEAVAGSPDSAIPPTAQSRGVWLQADEPSFARPVLELKTDLRI
jgi:hypothetical protein